MMGDAPIEGAVFTMADGKLRALWQWLSTYGKTILITAVVVFFIRWKVVEPFYIPSSSMEPTLKRLDRILVNKLKYRIERPQRWDVLVFKDPQDHRRNFIKRIVGLPGETLSIQDGEIYVNGVRQEKPDPLKSIFYTDIGRWGTLEPVHIPDGCYFVLGDNSERSLDSRLWKGPFVTEAEIVGEAVTVIWPPERVCLIK
ncbi:MAG TPA: signal peptidase I [Planctomycetota bacterium]|nr:signal peptidase I [Planctomycetota bacterium]HUW35046.1 signal peptidase I [Planctomycetota bacterium]